MDKTEAIAVEKRLRGNYGIHWNNAAAGQTVNWE